MVGYYWRSCITTEREKWCCHVMHYDRAETLCDPCVKRWQLDKWESKQSQSLFPFCWAVWWVCRRCRENLFNKHVEAVLLVSSNEYHIISFCFGYARFVLIHILYIKKIIIEFLKNLRSSKSLQNNEKLLNVWVCFTVTSEQHFGMNSWHICIIVIVSMLHSLNFHFDEFGRRLIRLIERNRCLPNSLIPFFICCIAITWRPKRANFITSASLRSNWIQQQQKSKTENTHSDWVHAWNIRNSI